MTFYKDIFILLHFYLCLQTCFVNGAVKSSLVFVIDDTGSMTDEINQVKQKTYEVFDAVLSSNGSAIDEFVLVTFNDPGTQLRITTRDKYAYKREVERIDVDGGGDCEEMAMAGIQLALENSKPNSFLYVFTDASAKDYDKFEQVKSLSLKKSSQVTFLLTGLCDGTSTPDYLVFEKLSKATSGQVFNVEKDDINKVIDFIIESIKHKKTTLGKKEFGNSDATKSMTFTVDSKIWDVLISISAATPQFHVLGPDNTELTVETITNSASTYFGKLNTVPGTYTVVLNNVDHDARRSPPSVVVTGSTSVTFQHGFSTFKPSTITETSTKPIPDQPSFLSIELENNNRDVLLNTVELRDENDNVIKEIPLVLVDEEQQFYTTEAFYPPPVTFKIAINGYTPTNERITRVSPTTVEYQKPDLITETIKNLVPQVAILEGATVNAEYKKPLTVHCKVTAYPKPDVSWLNEKGEYIPSKVNAVDLPYEYMSIVNLEKVKKNGTLTCIARNSLGEVMSSANIRVKTFFNVLEYPSDTTIEYGATKHLKLMIDSLPTATIVWYKGDDVINNSEYFDISVDNHTLTIKDMQLTLKGSYAVEVFNGLHAQRFDFEIFTSGTDPPVVEIDGGDRLVKVGELIRIPCYVTGVPVPSVRWLVDGLEINATKKYKIYRDNTLSFRSAVQDMGVYTCEASNPLGKARKDVRLDVFVPVNIQSPEQSIVELKVGDSVILPCVADGFPRPNIEWMFFSKDPRTAPKSLRKDITNSVVIDRVQLNDEGLYTCVASNTNSLSNITYEVIVKAPPTIVNTLPDKTIEVVKGDLVLRIPCKVEGNPKPTVTWKFENGLNIVTGTEWYDVEEDGTLIIKNIDEYDAGIYICKAENSLGSNFENYRVTVVDFPTPDPSSVTNILLEEGKSFEVKCEISYKKSDLIRWFKDGRFIKDGDLILNNVDATDAGMYSCRVSNFLKSDSSHTNVIVGFKPTFTSDEETNIDFAAGAFIGLSCEARGEPKPKVQWRKNDQFIEETSMFYVLLMETNDIGQYTCEVSNEFGTISRTFNIIDAKGCTLNIDKNFETKQPLLLSTEEVNLVTLRSADGLLKIPAKHNILMFCPNSHINIQGIKLGDHISGSCVDGSIVNVDGVDVDFADIRCNDKIVPLTKSTGVSCGPGNTELLNIGYDTGFEFVVIYDVCVDKNNKLPIYTKHVMYPIAANTVPNEKIDFVGSKHLPFQFEDMYDCWRQRLGVLSLTGKRLSTDNRCCFAKRQLVNPRDVVPGYQQVATYNYLNVVPKWGTCGTENWDEVEERVRSLVKLLDHPLEVYTGSSHLMKLPAQPKPNTVHLVDRFNRQQPVPRYIWKVIINNYNGDAVVVIQNNIPDITQHQAVSFMLCKDICHEVDWMRSRRPEEWRDVKKGFTFCCNVKEFETAFGFKDIFKIRELSSKVLLL